MATGYTNADLEVFRWTEADSIVRIGGSTLFLGAGAAEPTISDDGPFIAASSAAPDSLVVAPGRWSVAGGWQALMPPLIPGGEISTGSIGNAWAFPATVAMSWVWGGWPPVRPTPSAGVKRPELSIWPNPATAPGPMAPTGTAR